MELEGRMTRTHAFYEAAGVEVVEGLKETLATGSPSTIHRTLGLPLRMIWNTYLLLSLILHIVKLHSEQSLAFCVLRCKFKVLQNSSVKE